MKNQPIATVFISTHISAQGRLLSVADGIAEVDTGSGIKRGRLIGTLAGVPETVAEPVAV